MFLKWTSRIRLRLLNYFDYFLFIRGWKTERSVLSQDNQEIFVRILLCFFVYCRRMLIKRICNFNWISNFNCKKTRQKRSQKVVNWRCYGGLSDTYIVNTPGNDLTIRYLPAGSGNHFRY